VKKRVRVGLRLGAKQLRQFSDIGGDPASFVFGHQVGAGAPPQLAFVVDARHRKAVRVFDNEARAVGFLERPGRREATVRYQVQSSSSSRRAGGIYVANGDFNGTLDVSTFLSSFLAFFTPSSPPSFPFLLASAVPLLSWTFDVVLHWPSWQRGPFGIRVKYTATARPIPDCEA
jgi:hypothetical protein